MVKRLATDILPDYRGSSIRRGKWHFQNGSSEFCAIEYENSIFIFSFGLHEIVGEVFQQLANMTGKMCWLIVSADEQDQSWEFLSPKIRFHNENSDNMCGIKIYRPSKKGKK